MRPRSVSPFEMGVITHENQGDVEQAFAGDASTLPEIAAFAGDLRAAYPVEEPDDRVRAAHMDAILGTLGGRRSRLKLFQVNLTASFARKAAAATAAISMAFSGLAAAGALPSGLQQRVAEIARVFGLDLPGDDEPEKASSESDRGIELLPPRSRKTDDDMGEGPRHRASGAGGGSTDVDGGERPEPSKIGDGDRPEGDDRGSRDDTDETDLGSEDDEGADDSGEGDLDDDKASDASDDADDDGSDGDGSDGDGSDGDGSDGDRDVDVEDVDVEDVDVEDFETTESDVED